jgi:DNA polymerase elongation subunit (family B)
LLSDRLRILAIDIETRPNLAYVWKLWDESVGQDQLVEAHEVMCFAAKWVGSSETMFSSTYSDGKKSMLKKAHELLDEADAILHWNGKKFDLPHLNREFLIAEMPPPAPVTQIDLMLVARKHFRFPSNSLAHVSTALGLGKKKSTGGFKLWRACMEGDEKAWATMKRYNIQDVKLLEEAYQKLLPWIHNHPQRNLYGGEGCLTCGSDNIQRRGLAHTRMSIYQRYQCKACGTWFRGARRIRGADTQRIAT